MEQGIDQLQFKNLVKNRLIKDKERNKENANTAEARQLKTVENRAAVETRMLLERNSNRFDTQTNRVDSLKSSKL